LLPRHAKQSPNFRPREAGGAGCLDSVSVPRAKCGQLVAYG
jgi:hypothetical protein